MAALAPLISDLGGGRVTAKETKNANFHNCFSEVVYENSTVESLIKVLMESAPELFPTRLNAEIMLIPAFLKNGLLNENEMEEDVLEITKPKPGGEGSTFQNGEVGGVGVPKE
ncbi:hypothetical protein K505DRAFT_362944 [Melanomma pulvis-pyrius CBS 109.77]|uniref:Uncharacterized protein n=1 Tax=Melanomma pulvis-pyrius CBS 109.77 TaxID=1314802 RepID=A0A6A6X8F7_9PLEO|nr:hypothetical protein K505DRAFT_362944 [Melanomma pulvis-pyrius CBS 109.77]